MTSPLYSYLKLVLLCLLISGILFCGSNSSTSTEGENPAQSAPGSSNQSLSENTDDANLAKGGMKVDLTPEILTTAVEIKAVVASGPELKDNERYTYTFWKNSEILREESDNDTLPPSLCKRGDVLFADVTLYRDDQKIMTRRSDMVSVDNALPVIEDVVFPEVNGVGTYTVTVNATDADKDKLIYSLETEGLPVNISIEPGTGVITCHLTKDTPETLAFRVSVDDGNGGIAKKDLSMNFFKQAPPSGSQ